MSLRDSETTRDMDRASFAARQAQMTSNWYESVKQREGNVEAYIAKRQAAYLDRWKEAGRFIPDGSTVLDVGGGNMYAALCEYLREKRLDYFYIDVDPSAVDASRAVAGAYGFPGSHFALGFNDQFEFPEAKFDAVFSSHCIEHSFDLQATFGELNRVLKSGGFVLMAVPFGWEENPEHPYFFGLNHWISIVEDAGFQVRVAQVGREYPESGYDLFVAARKVENPRKKVRIHAADYRKDSYAFFSPADARIRYAGNVSPVDDGRAMHLRGDDWNIEIDMPAAKEILPVFKNHDWSGIVEISTGNDVSRHDLFSWFSTVQPVRHNIAAEPVSNLRITIRPAGRNAASWSTEAVVYGIMFR